MDALKALAGQQGCSADGTAAQRNPLSGFVNQAMGAPVGAGNQMQGGPQHRQANEIERGMAQGMGAMPRGPMMAQQQQQNNAFVQEFEQMRGGPPPGPMMRGPMGPRGAANVGMDQQQWVNDFERMKLGGAPPGPNIHMEAAYRNSFRMGAAPRPMGQRWAGQMAARPRPPPAQMDQAWKQTSATPKQWANEMAGPKQAPDGEQWAKEATKGDENKEVSPDMEATRRAADDLVRVMASNPKFRDSEFFNFMSKVNTGELAFENNQVVETAMEQQNMDNAWNTEKNLDQAWNDEKQQLDKAWDEGAMGKIEQAFEKAWTDVQGGKEVDFGQMYQDAMQEAGLSNADLEETMKAVQQNPMDKAWSETQTANLANTPYEMAQENPFAAEENPYERGMELFQAGELHDAILSFEAAVTKDGTHADAWRMLGVAHQENDQDPKAISCLERAVENDAYHLDALLGLGVSYVNELDQDKALKNLKAWIVNNPNFHGLEVSQDPYGDGSLMDDVMQLMLKAAEWAPNDPDVQEVLGVLYNVSRDYNSAVLCFKKALNSKPDDYSLWNKLGATLANGQRSEDALPAYRRALELRPKYTRGFLNMGISFSNLGSYNDAARAYLTTLKLNPEAQHVWSYLRIAFTCMERFDLIGLCDKRDLDAFKPEFNF